jgi:hypothetical protein
MFAVGMHVQRGSRVVRSGACGTERGRARCPTTCTTARRAKCRCVVPLHGQAAGERQIPGGSAIGNGVCVRKSGPAPVISGHLTGFIRMTATHIDEVRGLLAGNPVCEAGGTVEIREPPEK